MGGGASIGFSAAITAASTGDLKMALNGLDPATRKKLADALKPRNDLWGASGYCPVSYFGEAPAHAGSADAPSEYEGATYLFSNADVVKMFVEGPPTKFLPQYGAFCSMAMSMNVLKTVDKDVYTVSEGLLYLFGNVEAKTAFDADKANLVGVANSNWQNGTYTDARA
jgi:YHS domain-containing protein